MSQDANHGPLWVIGIKSVVFTILTVLATAILATTIRNSSAGEAQTYTAIFSDATSVNRGDDVRMVGVKVGTVSDVGLTDNRLAKVTFTIRKGVRVDAGSIIQIKFRNLVGQRYLAVEQPALTGTETVSSAGAAGTGIHPASATIGTVPQTVKAGHTFGLEETRGALDLTLLFNGFRPLLRMLDADDVNKLSEQIVAVFQGEDATVDGLLQSTASLTTTLASKDQVIGELITSLSGVMTTVNDRAGQLDTTLVTMQQLVSGLSSDRAAIGSSIAGMGELTTRVGELFSDIRPSFRNSINDLGVLSANLDRNSDQVDNFLAKLPIKLDRIGRTASYGSWLNFYLCSMDGRIPMAEGYMGDLGAKPVAGRCR